MYNRLWSDGPILIESPNVFPLGTDSVMLADFSTEVNTKKNLRVCDLGCGSGIISIILAFLHPNITIDAIDISPIAVEVAKNNVKLNSLSDRVNIMHGDIKHHSDFFKAGEYDLVVSNPPYFGASSGKLHSNEDISIARSEAMCTLEDICTCAGYITRWGGLFKLVHKPERLADIFRNIQEVGIEPKRLRLIQNTPAAPPSLILVEGRRGGKPSLIIDAPLIMTDDEGNESQEVKEIYRR